MLEVLYLKSSLQKPICGWSASQNTLVIQAQMRMNHLFLSQGSCVFAYISVTLFDELFNTENVKQVYSIVTDWLAQLNEEDRRKIKYVIIIMINPILGKWAFK